MQLEINENPWFYFHRFMARRLAFLEIGANMAGSGIVTCYFFFFNFNRALPLEDLRIPILVVVIMSVGLVFLALTILNNWEKDLELFVTLKARNHPLILSCTGGLSAKFSTCLLSTP